MEETVIPIDRKSFLRGEFSARRAPLRPPWAPPEHEFTARCERCDDCIRACPEHILVRGRGGFPRVEFSAGACTFCGRCIETCAGRALAAPAVATHPAWSVKAAVTDACLSLRGTICRSCAETCEPDAIRFRLEVGGRSRPLIDLERCTGCGGCLAVCPADAMLLGPNAAEPTPNPGVVAL